MKNIIFWTWCLPQTLVGLILKLIFRGKKMTMNSKILGKTIEYYSYKCDLGSISLGKYLLISDRNKYSPYTIKHEYGHQIQSFILGPLYLLLVVLPSLIWAGCFKNYRIKHNVGYYDVYPEKWANKLVGLK